MIKSELLKDKGVLIVSPVGPLAASDFEQLAQEVDPYIEQIGFDGSCGVFSGLGGFCSVPFAP